MVIHFYEPFTTATNKSNYGSVRESEVGILYAAAAVGLAMVVALEIGGEG